MQTDRRFYTYLQVIGPYTYIGKGCGKRYLSACPKTRGRLYRHAIEKYGLKKAEILHFYESEEEAFRDEIRIIADLRAIEVKLLNLSRGGDGASGYRQDEETRIKIRNTRASWGEEKKKQIRHKFLATMNAKSAVEKAEIRRKQSEANKGKPKPPISDEHRKNLSLSHLDKSPANKGVPKSAEEIARRTATRRENNSGNY